MAKGASGERRRGSASPRDPYPFIYSRDMWDIRRFSPLGRAPGGGGPSRWGVRFAVALIVALLGGSLLLLLIQAAQTLLR